MRSLLLAVSVSIVALPTAHRCWAGPPDTRDYHPLRSGGGKCLDGAQKARPTMEDCADAASQRWKLTPVKAGYYTFTTEASGAKWCLDVVNDQKANNRLQLARCTEATGQYWKLTPGDAGSYALTTEWQGDAKCLAMGIDGTDIVPLLNKCTSVAVQRWSVASDAKAGATAASPPAPTKSSFILVYSEGCQFAVSGVTGSVASLLECGRAGAEVTCSVRNVTAMGDLISDTLRPQSTFTAAVTTDTRDALTFATANGAVKIEVKQPLHTAALTQRLGARTTTCEGLYNTPAEWAKLKTEVRNSVASPDEPADSGADDSPRESRSPSKPAAPTKKKGLDRGRMCGKDSECDSGTCKMENRTRGRCS